MYGHRFPLCVLDTRSRYSRWARGRSFSVVSMDHADVAEAKRVVEKRLGPRLL